MAEREKRIEEIARILCKQNWNCTKCTFENGCLYKDNAQLIYDAAYRRADEVRKETAKEILQEIASVFYAVGDVFELTRQDIQELAEHYGVEVEE